METILVTSLFVLLVFFVVEFIIHRKPICVIDHQKKLDENSAKIKEEYGINLKMDALTDIQKKKEG